MKNVYYQSKYSAIAGVSAQIIGISLALKLGVDLIVASSNTWFLIASIVVLCIMLIVVFSSSLGACLDYRKPVFIFDDEIVKVRKPLGKDYVDLPIKSLSITKGLMWGSFVDFRGQRYRLPISWLKKSDKMEILSRLGVGPTEKSDSNII